MSDPRAVLLEALELNLQAQQKLHEALTSLDKTEEAITAEDAAAQLGITTRHLHRKIRAGEIKAHKVGRRWLVMPSDLQSYTGGNALTVSEGRGLGQKGLA